jgi:hypothetical protein
MGIGINMIIKNNKIIILLLIGLISGQFYINKKDPKKVIADKMVESEKNSHTGYRVFNNYQEVPTKKNDLRSYYSSSDIQKMIYKAKPNDIIVLDKDVYLKFAIFIDKPLTIKGDTESRKILGKEITSMFMTNSDNIVFDSLDFYLIDTLFFIQSDSNSSLEPLRKNLKIINSRINLEGKSNNFIRMDNLHFENVVVKNKTIEQNFDCALLEYYGKKINIIKSIFLDFNNTCNGGLRFSKLKSGEIKDSLFVAYPLGLNGVVTIDKSENVLLQNNIFLDLNREFRENLISENENNLEQVDDEDTDVYIGSIGISFYDTKAEFVSTNVMVTDNTFYSTDPIKNDKLAISIVNDEILNNIKIDNYKIKCKSWKNIIEKINDSNILNSFCIK